MSIKRFKLGGVDWKVKIDTGRLRDIEVMGLCEYNKATITLTDDIEEKLTGEILYHELIHAILDTMGEHELSCNEKFVQNFAVLLNQFEVTKK